MDLSTEHVVAAYLSGNPLRIEQITRRILTDETVRRMVRFAERFIGDISLLEQALHDAVLALHKNIENKLFFTGSWRGYLRKIFWAKCGELQNIYLPKKQPTAALKDYWLQPITIESIEQDRREGYELAFQLLDHLEPCRRDFCSQICRFRFEDDMDYFELLDHLDEINLQWDRNEYTNPDETANRTLRYQRLRDRVRECLRRVRKHLTQHPHLAEFFKDLK
jgi:hypothetical protein